MQFELKPTPKAVKEIYVEVTLTALFFKPKQKLTYLGMLYA